ncbi:unnamed protein product [Anisakis simplex]|uniref:mRNA (guanine-N(7))-methyltransferase n=1 Tax=Anisakis simplex TaxID=6269 RepID=A0A3P6PCH2_ANISI|nr:unnamed protein product [Anisakis simplex]
MLEKYSSKDISFDICSCQFSFHYCFESEDKARRMIRNAIERIRPGGFFVGTLPDAERIWLNNGTNGVYSNDVVRLEYDDKEVLNDPNGKPPIFGAKFHFSLDTQVNCPEYLVHFPVIVFRLLNECGMELIYKKRFPDAIDYYLGMQEGRGLMGRMQALEPYPPFEGVRWIYLLCWECFQGTLSKSEWEVTAMYLVFAFRKKNNAKLKESICISDCFASISGLFLIVSFNF